MSQNQLNNYLQEITKISYNNLNKENSKDHTDILTNFIVFEGIDGSGSSTQLKLFEQKLTELNVPYDSSSEPTSGTIGRHIRSILQETSNNSSSLAIFERQKLAQYFAADRAEHIWGHDGLESKTQQGILALSDRYLFSSLVYQGLDSQNNLSLEEIWQLNINFPLPEHLIYIDIDPELADQRITERQNQTQQKREIFERKAQLVLIRHAYIATIEQLAKLQPKMKVSILQGDQTPEKLHQCICQCLEHKIATS